MNWDLDFYVSEATFADNPITIKRAGVGYLFRLLALLLSFFDSIESLKCAYEDIDNLSANIDKIKSLLDNESAKAKMLADFLSHFTDIETDKLSIEELINLSKHVLSFNMPPKKGDGGEIKNGVMLNNILNDVICQTAFCIGKDPMWVSENVTYVQCAIILCQYRKFRLGSLTDMRVAMNAGKEDYSKHVRELSGLTTFAEAMNG